MKRIVSMVTAGALIATLIVPANVVSTQAKVKKQTISLTVGAVKKLQVSKSFAKKNVKWKSSNKSVVTVNKSGKIKAVSVGKANVTARTTGKKGQLAAKFVIKVTKKKVEATTAPATTTAPQVTQTPVATCNYSTHTNSKATTGYTYIRCENYTMTKKTITNTGKATCNPSVGSPIANISVQYKVSAYTPTTNDTYNSQGNIVAIN